MLVYIQASRQKLLGWAENKKNPKKVDKFDKLKETDDYVLKYTFTENTASTTANGSNYISSRSSPRPTTSAAPPEIMRTVRKFLEKEREEKKEKDRVIKEKS